ncbi:FAD-dependent oxidoreductase [Zhengella mangrovi]|uniref:FAD-dependent oxidoreductase n=1 Tax=Zhengella mangrovi TaxID=1982044 RepID=A0A2G1QL64_9HYPH|nr:FAD-binding oxidoreductase [Zhengella mangrovi]PHP66273.1 FAD-dependent oxidoreductase [Zhengella mangrovi]
MVHMSAISPGLSWYEATAGDRPDWPALKGDHATDVLVIGGGFTGLSAAVQLASDGIGCILIEGHRVGDGASGRNGGQLGTGQRAWAEELEGEIGLERARALFAIAEDAKTHLHDFTRIHQIDMEYMPGQMSVVHKPRYLDDYRAHADLMAERFDYPHIRYMDKAETAERLGSTRYHGGIRDTGTGHIHPLKLVIGTARAAAQAGAAIHENTPALSIGREGGKVVVTVPGGTIRAERCLLATNAYGETLEPVSASHIMPIRSFIGATVPLGDDTPVIPGSESVDDSRFVVRYFRKSRDGRLLFGGREAYTAEEPKDISTHVRKQIAEIYPGLADVEITHAWGGSVGITIPRKPFVRDVMPGVTAIGGFSGHGVLLSNHTGRLYAEAVAGKDDRLRYYRDLKVPPFPGGRMFRKPLLLAAMTWFSMLDRI